MPSTKAMPTDKLRGLWVASLTPLTADDRIDVALLARHARWLIEHGCDGVALFGTTGEGQSFTVRERLDAVDGLLRAGVPAERVVVGTGCAAIPDAVELTRHALASNVAAAMLLPSFFWKNQGDAAIANGIGRVIEGVDDPRLRVVLYHIPQVSSVGIEPPAVETLRRRFGPVIAGIKDSSADWVHYDSALTRFPELLHFVGAEPQFVRALDIGGAGTICGLGNIAPAAMAELRERRGAASQAQRQIESLCRLFVFGHFLPTAKAMMAAVSGEPGWRRVRAPLQPVDDRVAGEIAAALDAVLAKRRAA